MDGPTVYDYFMTLGSLFYHRAGHAHRDIFVAAGADLLLYQVVKHEITGTDNVHPAEVISQATGGSVSNGDFDVIRKTGLDFVEAIYRLAVDLADRFLALYVVGMTGMGIETLKLQMFRLLKEVQQDSNFFPVFVRDTCTAVAGIQFSKYAHRTLQFSFQVPG